MLSAPPVVVCRLCASGAPHSLTMICALLGLNSESGEDIAGACCEGFRTPAERFRCEQHQHDPDEIGDKEVDDLHPNRREQNDVRRSQAKLQDHEADQPPRPWLGCGWPW